MLAQHTLSIRIRNIQRLPTTPFSLVLRKEYFTVHRETLTQYSTFKRGGEGSLFSCILYSLATVMPCINALVRIVTKSPKVRPLLIFSSCSWIAVDVWSLSPAKNHKMSLAGNTSGLSKFPKIFRYFIYDPRKPLLRQKYSWTGEFSQWHPRIPGWWRASLINIFISVLGLAD